MNLLLIHGPNAYLSRKRLSEITSAFERDHGESSVTYLDGSSALAERVLSEIDSISMFNPQKLVVVKYFSETSESKRFVEFFQDSKLTGIKEVDFIFWENKAADKRSVFYKFFKKEFEVEEFAELKGKSLENWIIEEFESLGQKVSPTVAQKIAERVGEEMWRISSEIEKLSLYKKGWKITVKDVEDAVPASAAVEVWGLTNSIATANKNVAISNLEKLIRQGNDIHQIWGLIVWQFRQLILIKYEQSRGTSPSSIASKLKFSPFVVSKIVNSRQSISFEKLKVLYDKLVEIDFQIKTSVTDPLFAITLLLSVI